MPPPRRRADAFALAGTSRTLEITVRGCDFLPPASAAISTLDASHEPRHRRARRRRGRGRACAAARPLAARRRRARPAGPARWPRRAVARALRADPARMTAVRESWRALWSSRLLVWAAGVGTVAAFGFGPTRKAFDPPGRDQWLRLARRPARGAGRALGLGLVSGDRPLRLSPRSRRYTASRRPSSRSTRSGCGRSPGSARRRCSPACWCRWRRSRSRCTGSTA